jgi:uncharacterized damage-inducible protein DinB
MKPTPPDSPNTSAEFIAASRTLLAGDYLPKLRVFLEMLSDDDLWWRPNRASNSVGNLILHMCGNLRQWIVSGVGGAPDQRDRDAEFAARGGRSIEDMMDEVEETASEVDRTLAGLRESALLQRVTVQGFSVSRLHAVYHSVEHFGYHLGQIAYVVKLRTGKDPEIFG